MCTAGTTPNVVTYGAILSANAAMESMEEAAPLPSCCCYILLYFLTGMQWECIRLRFSLALSTSLCPYYKCLCMFIYKNDDTYIFVRICRTLAEQACFLSPHVGTYVCEHVHNVHMHMQT